LAGNNHLVGALAGQGVELELGLALVAVLAVAIETILGENGPHVAPIVHGRRRGLRRNGEAENENQTKAHRHLGFIWWNGIHPNLFCAPGQ
jgi:hypothetical protein